MLVSTRAIIIHTFPYSESSIILKAYTETFGFASFLLKGFKRNKKQKINLHPLALVELSCIPAKSNSLALGRNISLLNPYSQITSNPIKSGMAMFLAEFLSHSLREAEEGDPAFFIWLTNAIEQLEEADHLANFHLWFLLTLSEHLGFAPQGNKSIGTPYFSIEEGSFIKNNNTPGCLSDKDAELMNSVINKNLIECSKVQLSREERAVLINLLHSYFKVHLDKDFALKSIDVLSLLYVD